MPVDCNLIVQEYVLSKVNNSQIIIIETLKETKLINSNIIVSENVFIISEYKLFLWNIKTQTDVFDLKLFCV